MNPGQFPTFPALPRHLSVFLNGVQQHLQEATMQIVTFGRRLVPDLPGGQSNDREGTCTDHRECDWPRKLVFKMYRKAQADESNVALPEGVVSVVGAATPKSQSRKVTLRHTAYL
jgi:hypothetical protein